jgi:hypothetical protein
MCMQDNYFQFNGRFYRQTFGTSMMGNALLPLLANIFMADYESKLSKLKIFPKIWIGYVDDIFCVMKKDTIDRLLVIMNRRQNTIKFTHEIEKNGTLKSELKSNAWIKKLSFNVYRKPNATPRYIPNESHHSIQHKSAAFNSMVHRLVNIPMSPDDVVSELNEIKNIAKINDPKHFDDRIHTNHRKKNKLQRLTTLIPVSKDRPNKRHLITFYPHITITNYKIFSANTTSIWYIPTNEHSGTFLVIEKTSSEFWRNPGCIKSSVLVAMLCI